MPDDASDGEFALYAELAQDRRSSESGCGPARRIGARPVGVEVPRGHVLEAGTLFEVADVELDDGVLAVESVDGHGVTGEVGQEPRSGASPATASVAGGR